MDKTLLYLDKFHTSKKRPFKTHGYCDNFPSLSFSIAETRFNIILLLALFVRGTTGNPLRMPIYPKRK